MVNKAVKEAMAEAGVNQQRVAACLGVKPSTVSMKMAGHRPWRREEMAAVRELLSEEAGRRYTVDELFFSEAGAA